MARLGDSCGRKRGRGRCQGVLRCTSSHVDRAGGVRVRYLKCDRCGHNPRAPQIVPLEYAPPRPRRKKK